MLMIWVINIYGCDNALLVFVFHNVIVVHEVYLLKLQD